VKNGEYTAKKAEAGLKNMAERIQNEKKKKQKSNPRGRPFGISAVKYAFNSIASSSHMREVGFFSIVV